MEMELVGSTLATALIALVAVIAVTRVRTGCDALRRRRGELAEQQANTARALENLAVAQLDLTEARVRLDATEATIAELKTQRETALSESDAMHQGIAEVEKAAAFADQAREAVVQQQKSH